MTLFLTAFVDNKSFESQHTSKKVFQGGHVDAIDLISNGRLAGSGDGALAPSKTWLLHRQASARPFHPTFTRVITHHRKIAWQLNFDA